MYPEIDSIHVNPLRWPAAGLRVLRKFFELGAPGLRFCTRICRKWIHRASLRYEALSPYGKMKVDSSSSLIPLNHLYENSTQPGDTDSASIFEHLLDVAKTQTSDRATLRYLICESHMTDISNINRILAGEESSLRIFSADELMVMCCQWGNKTQCWSCNLQICPGCSVRVFPPLPGTTSHIHFCEPWCSKCYYKQKCGPESSKNVCLGEGHMFTREWKEVCSNCAREPVERLIAKKETMETTELASTSRLRLKCGSCRGILRRNGPIWWACSRCKGECSSRYHPTWAKPSA